MDLEFWIDVFGWIGSAEVVIAYAMNSYQRIRSDSAIYQWLNLSGSIFLLINTAWYGAFPSAAVNIVWMYIAISSLIRVWVKRKSSFN